MPAHKSAEKRVRTAEKARLVNRTVRSTIRTSLKKVRGAASQEEAAKELPNLFSLLDKAARRRQGGLTRNAASNYKRKAQLALTKKGAPQEAAAKPAKSAKPAKAAKASKSKSKSA